jgi:hypothetical protein
MMNKKHPIFQAFAAGADIKEMQNRDYASNYRENFLGKLTAFAFIEGQS